MTIAQAVLVIFCSQASSGSFCQNYRVTDEAFIAETMVLPNFFLMNVFFALKGSKLFIIISYHCSWMLCRVAAVKSLPDISVFETTAVIKFCKFTVFSFDSFCQIYRVTDEAFIAKTMAWPNFFLMNVFFVLKGSKLFIIIISIGL